MVGNNNNWEDDDFLDDDILMDDPQDDFRSNQYKPDSSINEKFADDDYSQGNNNYSDESEEDYGEYDDYEDAEQPQRKSGGAAGLIVLLFLIGIVALIVVGVMKLPALIKPQAETAPSVIEQPQVSDLSNASTTEEVADAFFKEAGGDTQDMMSVNFGNDGETNVSTPVASGEDAQTENPQEGDLFADAKQNPENSNEVVVTYNNISRLNPFKPFETALLQSLLAIDRDKETLANIPFEVIEPPSDSVEDEKLTALLSTQISGILYDEQSPSAIVNINGQDQFVKVGDTISGYEIQNITRDKVQISYMENTYVASVGELFVRGSLERQPAVDNLQNKFAGRYKRN